MTNNTMIIDSIDVSICLYFMESDTYCDINDNYCGDNPNCHFKQLKRKEQENERYKKALTDIEKYVNCSCGYYIPHGAIELIQDIINKTKGRHNNEN